MHGSLPGLAAGRFGVIMFFSACRLPSFAPEDPPSHASENQITTGQTRETGAHARRRHGAHQNITDITLCRIIYAILPAHQI